MRRKRGKKKNKGLREAFEGYEPVPR